MPQKFLIVGLGNIGKEYEHTHHNVGFDIVEKLVNEANGEFRSERYGQVAELKLKGNTLVVLQPNTYMNLSGEAVRYWAQKEKVALENILIVVDDLAIPAGAIRLKGKGSPGGHNGLKNISLLLGTDNYARLRFGIGSNFSRGGQVDFVLSGWSDEEKPMIDERMKLAAEVVRQFCLQGLEKTMTQYNNK
ncbi:MAG: aminoacyl-tRNA hydrolase [Bacteroidales bacterium]|nr:aminoacyl-tRNA hydrolase [Bacteroidales bacterium]MBR6250992.1 aminoacyl-tRNA hydrolase [Bacteroidales bacterium]